jgi:hypothetical protein
MLDGKQITDNSRQFLMSWKASREAQQLREKSKPDLLESGIDNLNNGGKLKTSNLRIGVIWIKIASVSTSRPNFRSTIARAHSVTLYPATGPYTYYRIAYTMPPFHCFQCEIY